MSAQHPLRGGGILGPYLLAAFGKHAHGVAIESLAPDIAHQASVRAAHTTAGLPALGRALPGRVNLVMTRSGRVPFEGMEPVAGIDAALAAVAGHEAGELCVIGGGEIYREWLPLADVLQLTHVDTLIDGADAWFPEWSPAQWREVSRAAHAADARHRFAFEFVEYVRSDG